MSNKLYDADHPYYATHGCYYVGVAGHYSRHTGYDGNTCHANYASWEDFKAGNDEPFSNDDLLTRARMGVKEPTPEEEERQVTAFGHFSFFDADKDYNLLYRWDWKVPDPADYSNSTEVPGESLELFYMLQRKARPQSCTINNLKREQEPEIRAWLFEHWKHMMRLWAPVSGWPAGEAKYAGVELPDDRDVDTINAECAAMIKTQDHQCLEHAASSLAEMAARAK